jgi:hypothetical protein
MKSQNKSVLIIGQDSNKTELFTTPLGSGFGRYHTDRLNSQGTNRPKPLLSITMQGIINLAENPPSVEKDKAQWCMHTVILNNP